MLAFSAIKDGKTPTIGRSAWGAEIERTKDHILLQNSTSGGGVADFLRWAKLLLKRAEAEKTPIPEMVSMENIQNFVALKREQNSPPFV
jgi:hypothetical protein